MPCINCDCDFWGGAGNGGYCAQRNDCRHCKQDGSDDKDPFFKVDCFYHKAFKYMLAGLGICGGAVRKKPQAFCSARRCRAPQGAQGAPWHRAHPQHHI